ncbi:hypothetical protein [Solirubrum puertoriconensis]|uniref:Uncharacterized protein n=1 Tax=Solirubrum puertoriconensis TaxID=1751427 RepID=A0A9X0HPF7_SOLP1|nr:hypothetical protein [Solirubrum puertoriconensis]KUG09783.1 hypothetical protein ASU33_19105 [Solirubrum puertoriconensis]
MHKLLAIFLTGLILLQSFSREVLVLDYALHKERITQLFCVNKDKPQMRCHGQCHLRKQLAKTTDQESKAPGSTGKVKYDAVLPLPCFAAESAVLPLAVRIAWPRLVAAYSYTWSGSIFHPPLLG